MDRRDALKTIVAEASGGEVLARLRAAFVAFAGARGLLDRGEATPFDDAPDLEDDDGAIRSALEAISGLEVELFGGVYEATLGLAVEARRKAGAHYTPRALSDRVARATVAPLLHERDAIDLRVADAAMGSGAFLLAALRVLEAGSPSRSRRALAATCLFGVDRDPLAARVARASLWLEVGDRDLPFDAFDRNLRVGDALVGAPSKTSTRLARFDWDRAFPEVFARSGFDAFVGNPPWISYAGRAAQPLDEARRAYYLAEYSSFAGYRNLQALFVERCVELLRAGGRLGLILPSSMSELQGYAPSRLAHDRLAIADAELEDLGNDAFAGVFQPCMALVSTKRERPVSLESASSWPMERRDLDRETRALMERMIGAPLPPHLFGERGFQSSADDTEHMSPVADDDHRVPLRVGSDIATFVLKAPSLFADARRLSKPLRDAKEWRRVRLLIRQTARVPIATLSDGLAFRNSILAGFEDDDHPATFLVAWLASTPIRWLHYVRFRDARQGMPQLKVGHLRAIPSPPARACVAKLTSIGDRLASANVGLDDAARATIDAIVFDAFDLGEDDRRRILDAADALDQFA